MSNVYCNVFYIEFEFYSNIDWIIYFIWNIQEGKKFRFPFSKFILEKYMKRILYKDMLNDETICTNIKMLESFEVDVYSN